MLCFNCKNAIPVECCEDYQEVNEDCDVRYN